VAFTILTCGGVSTQAFFYVTFFSQAHAQQVRHREWVEASKTYNLIIYCQHETCKSQKKKIHMANLSIMKTLITQIGLYIKGMHIKIDDIEDNQQSIW
jgi:hypothetical protein